MGETSGSLAAIGKYREELQCAVNGKTVCTTNQCVHNYDNTLK